MRTRIIGILLALAVASVSPTSVSAQLDQTGTLVGTVSDAQKLPLPGTTVTLTSPAIVRSEMFAVTEQNGSYRFLSLPPGLYDVTFEMDGMATLIRKAIQIEVGRTTTIDAVLELKGLSESVVVEGRAPTIDLQSNSNSTTMDQRVLTSVPAARNLDAYLNMVPGTTAEPNNASGLMSSVNGSNVRDNSFNIDGVNVTDPLVGTQLYEVGMDIIQEISIQSGGMSAEFGDAIGAAVNVVTRSGGNQLSGAVSYYYTGDALQSNNTAGTPLEGKQAGYQYVREPTFTLGGPFRKDTLWFFANGSFNQRSKNIAGFPYDQPNQVPAKESRPSAFAKLTFQPSATDRFIASYIYTDLRQDNNSATMFWTESSTIKWAAPTHLFNLQWMRTFSPKFYGDFKVGYVRTHQNLEPKNNDALLYELTTGRYSGGYWTRDLNLETRFQANGNVAYFVDGLAGSHQIKSGVELQITNWDHVYEPNTDPRNGMSLIYTNRGQPYYGLVADIPPQAQATTNLHAYVQDSWNPIKRLTFNLGLRLTHQVGRIPAQNETEGPRTFLGVTFDRSVPESLTAFSRTALAPRLGIIYDVTGDGKTTAKAGYARYIQSNLMQYFSAANPNGSFNYYQLLTPAWGLVPGGYVTAAYPGNATVGYEGSGLRAPYTDEWMIALERQLFVDWSLGARYTRKADRDLTENVNANQLDMASLMDDGQLVWTNWAERPFVDPFDGSTKTFWSQKAILANSPYLVNAPGAKRDFDGFELVLSKRYSRGWSVTGSYAWQDSRGLIGNTWSTGFGGSALYNNPNAHVDAYGHMQLQRRNQFRLQAMVTAPWDINVSGYLRSYSGQTYTRTVVSSDLGVPLSQGSTAINAEPMGSRELPAQTILDLRLEKRVRLGATSVALFADGFNVLNGNSAVAVQARSSSSALVFGEMTQIQNPRAFRLGFRFTF